jgi:hypothetical protein
MTEHRSQPRRSLPPGEWERLLREKSYIRPLAAVPSLHQMARRRIVTAGTDSQAGGNNTTKETTA